MTHYLTYSKFYSEEEAMELTHLLETAGISHMLKKEINQLPPVYIGEAPDPMVLVKIAPEHFERVSLLMEEQAEMNFEKPGYFHYFMNFTNAELDDVLKHPNNWNAYDNKVASLLLNQSINTVVKPNYRAAYRPEEVPFSWIIIGYLLCFTSILGIFAGLAITQAKKTLQTGEVVPIYNRQTIVHGKNMVAFGTVVTVSLISIRLYYSFSRHVFN